MSAEHFQFRSKKGRGMARKSLDLIERMSAIANEIDDESWECCSVVEKAEKESLRTVLDVWIGADPGGSNLEF